MIDKLKPNQTFVFGSNLQGNHYGGAAKQAYEQFGAIWGIGVGFAGQTYAIPTMDGIEQIELYVKQFKEIVIGYPDKEFIVTRIGCGIAGYSDEQIAPLFNNCPDNVTLPGVWHAYIK